LFITWKALAQANGFGFPKIQAGPKANSGQSSGPALENLSDHVCYFTASTSPFFLPGSGPEPIYNKIFKILKYMLKTIEYN